jgi:superfamily II DNA helicase RecQ
MVAYDAKYPQWGASFRPEYLKIARFAQEHNVERVLCLTATATPSVSEDICKSFSIPNEGIFRIPVFRPKYVHTMRIWIRYNLIAFSVFL